MSQTNAMDNGTASNKAESRKEQPREDISIHPPSPPPPPQYYDSEPSSQPPGYHKDSKSIPRNTLRPAPQLAGASASTIAAVLGYPAASPPVEENEKKRKSLLRRWKEWNDSWNPPGEWAPGGSEPRWNVKGANIDGTMNMERVHKKR